MAHHVLDIVLNTDSTDSELIISRKLPNVSCGSEKSACVVKKGFIGESPNVWLKFSLEGNDGPEKETKHSHCVVRKGSLENPQVFGSSFLLKEMMGP